MKKRSEQVNPFILLGANFPNVCQLLCCCYLYREPSISLLYWSYLGSIYQVYTMYIFMFFSKKTDPLEFGNQKNSLIKDASGGGTTSEREPGPVPCEDMLREDGQTISLHSFILVPMPPNCHHTKGWLQPFNPIWNWWLSQHLPSFCIPWCQPWPFNGPFWNSAWLLVWFPSAATIKWLASTFQPTMKLVIEPASAILLHSLMPALAFQWAILE